MTKLAVPFLVVAACSGGAIQLDLKMPEPGGVTQAAGGGLSMANGVIVDAQDGSDVCERLQVALYTSPTPPSGPPPNPPIAKGSSLSHYQDGHRCVIVIPGLAARDDYWLRVVYPVRSAAGVAYYSTGRPTLIPPSPGIVQFYPVKVVDKQSTKLTGTLNVEIPSIPGP